MEVESVRKIADPAILALQNAMALDRWKIRLKYQELNDDAGHAYVFAQQRDGGIILNPSHMENEEDTLMVLRHELLHFVLGPLDSYAAQVQKVVDSDETIGKVLAEAHDDAVERCLSLIEAMLDHGLGMTPKKMVAKGRK